MTILQLFQETFSDPSMYGYMEWSSEVQKEANWQRKECPTLTDVGGLWVHRIRLN